jgi:TonB family protein
MTTTLLKRTLAGLAGLLLFTAVLDAAAIRAPELKNRQEVLASIMAGHAGDLIRHGISATAELMVEVDEKGRVARHRLVRATGNKLLDQALSEAAARLAFVPAMEDGQAVKSWVLIPFVFGRGEVQ